MMSFGEPDMAAAPKEYHSLVATSDEVEFDMRSDYATGSLLRTLVGSKPGGRILELGTGTGIALGWMLAAADRQTLLISVDNDPQLIKIASSYYGEDPRVELQCMDGAEWIRTYTGPSFDLIFADAWPGKYELLEETLELVAPGGFYVIDDMLPQEDWPEGHAEKASALIDQLSNVYGFNISQLNYSTGLMILTKKNDLD